MTIIIEGPDGAGKTSLITKLTEVFPELHLMGRVVRKDTTTDIDLVEWVRHDNMLTWQPNIYDRHRLISEPIYGPILRRSSPGFDSWPWMVQMTRQFYSRRPFMVYCLPPKEVVKANIYEDTANDNTAIIDVWEPIYNAYVARAAIDRSMHDAFIYDFTNAAAFNFVRNQLGTRLRRYKNER